MRAKGGEGEIEVYRPGGMDDIGDGVPDYVVHLIVEAELEVGEI